MKLFCSVHLFNLVAFLAVLSSIVVLSLAGKSTDLAIMTGLVGILGSFKPWGLAPPPDGPSGTPGDPIAVAGANADAKPVETKEK
ncbi:hypothetical protein [Sphingomonas sp. URHD0057]|uniref:hypothetical protein n=1 Tax=Sphingomonas sp. URHD0057 TaxID=1380389 RepID=UPI00048D2925|nr:hypothetical protein [Sphingomonas sp. URHD0057]